MSRGKDAPIGLDCPYRHQCPHLDGLSTTWVMEVYQEADKLREQLHRLEIDSQQRIDQLQQALLERDAKIAQLRLEHQKHFKAKRRPAPIPVKVRRRGAPRGHAPWQRREPEQVDQVVSVPAPLSCPHCQSTDLQPWPEFHEHVQEDIVLMPQRPVRHAAGPGPTAMNFDRKATALGKPLYEQLRVMLQSAEAAYADETSWREDGEGAWVWYGGNEDLAVYQITDNRSAESAVQLLGKEFDGTLVSDDYAAYNAVEAKHRQTCWHHIRTRAKEIVQQIELIDPPIQAPRSIEFCQKLQRFSLRMCALGRQKRRGKLSLTRARAMIPALQRQLRRLGEKPLEHPAAQTLRQRVMEKDRDKLFTFLKVKGIEPTNNHSEQSVRFLVIMRKICFGTRSAAGSECHSVLPSLLQTARRQGQGAIQFLMALLTQPLDKARAALFADGS